MLNKTNFITAILLYKFQNINLLEKALIHPSKEKNFEFQRLELLGDKIFNFCLCHIIFDKFEKKNEGDLSILLSHLISTTLIAKLVSVHISPYIQYTGTLNNSIIADTFEAIIGAIYLDSNDLSIISNIIKILWLPYIEQEKNTDFKNPKNKLQETTPHYKCVIKEHKEHPKNNPNNNKFQVKMTSNGFTGFGEGSSKKIATSNGALALLKKLEEHSDLNK